MKDRLRALAGTLDPLGLLDEIRAVQHHLARSGRGLDGSSDAAARCRPRRLLRSLAAGLARRRGAADAPAPQETAATLAHSAGPVRDDVAPRRRVAGGGTASDGEGALRPSAAGAPGDVRPGPAPDSAAPRQGLAPSRRPSSRVCRSDGSVPRRCRFAEPGRRFERLGFRLGAIDREPGGSDRIAAWWRGSRSRRSRPRPRRRPEGLRLPLRRRGRQRRVRRRGRHGGKTPLSITLGWPAGCGS